MNKMYEYLEEHAYISKNKKSNYQFELTRERAECIANKYNSLCEEKDKEIERLKRLVQKRYYTMKDKLEVVNIFDDIQRCEIEVRDKEIERLNNIMVKAIDKIQYIIDYGFDYDGFNNVEDLKGLIDMLVQYAVESRNILKGENKE